MKSILLTLGTLALQLKTTSAVCLELPFEMQTLESVSPGKKYNSKLSSSLNAMAQSNSFSNYIKQIEDLSFYAPQHEDDFKKYNSEMEKSFGKYGRRLSDSDSLSIACPTVYLPVCCDGRTFSNDCFANLSGRWKRCARGACGDTGAAGDTGTSGYLLDKINFIAGKSDDVAKFEKTFQSLENTDFSGLLKAFDMAFNAKTVKHKLELNNDFPDDWARDLRVVMVDASQQLKPVDSATQQLDAMLSREYPESTPTKLKVVSSESTLSQLRDSLSLFKLVFSSGDKQKLAVCGGITDIESDPIHIVNEIEQLEKYIQQVEDLYSVDQDTFKEVSTLYERTLEHVEGTPGSVVLSGQISPEHPLATIARQFQNYEQLKKKMATFDSKFTQVNGTYYTFLSTLNQEDFKLESEETENVFTLLKSIGRFKSYSKDIISRWKMAQKLVPKVTDLLSRLKLIPSSKTSIKAIANMLKSQKDHSDQQLYISSGTTRIPSIPKPIPTVPNLDAIEADVDKIITELQLILKFGANIE